jgi:2-dehydro-3-deoxy-D-arabinonate dehydratase
MSSHALFVFRFLHAEFGPRLGVQTPQGRFDLTTLSRDDFGSVAHWLRLPDPVAFLSLALRQLEPADAITGEITLLAPCDTQEVWAAGVTYERSKVARMEESEDGGDFYDKVYIAERPELFMKAPGWRVIAPNQPIRVRQDSTWDVPEPEMTLVASSTGKLVGVTVGNDVSSRSIEGENPLYLPQAKCYDKSCALGPMVRVIDQDIALNLLPIKLEIERGGVTAYSGETSTLQMRRTPEELLNWLYKETTFPDGAFLMTGTGLVPPDSFTLQSGDVVTITIEGVGSLKNPVE